MLFEDEDSSLEFRLHLDVERCKYYGEEGVKDISEERDHHKQHTLDLTTEFDPEYMRLDVPFESPHLRKQAEVLEKL